MGEMSTTGKERQAALTARKRAAGLVQVAVWVPASRKAELMAYVATLLNEADEATPPPPTTTQIGSNATSLAGKGRIIK